MSRYQAKIIATDQEALQVISACSTGAKVKISKLDSTDSEVNKALDLLSDFYDREEKKRRKSEESEITELLLLEFAGLFNGTEGRLIQALKNDETVQTAIDILSNNSAYFSSLSSSGIIEN